MLYISFLNTSYVHSYIQACTVLKFGISEKYKNTYSRWLATFRSIHFPKEKYTFSKFCVSSFHQYFLQRTHLSNNRSHKKRSTKKQISFSSIYAIAVFSIKQCIMHTYSFSCLQLYPIPNQVFVNRNVFPTTSSSFF